VALAFRTDHPDVIVILHKQASQVFEYLHSLQNIPMNRELVQEGLLTYRRSRGIRNTSRHISFEFLFIKTCPPTNYITDPVSSFNSASESVM